MVTARDSESKKRKLDPSSADKKEKASKSQDKSISSANKKRALRHERQSYRPHYDEVTKAKDIWNKLRMKDKKKDEVDSMVLEIMGLFEGKMKEVVMKHDASRVVQALIQFGNSEQRRSILNELREVVPDMCKIQYAHFVVLKLIKYCARDDESRQILVKSLKGQISKLAVHAVGARVVELVFATLPSKSTLLLRQELYGPKFALFATGDLSTAALSLNQIVKQQPDNGASAIKFLNGVLDKGLEKSLFGFAFFQELCWEYCENCSQKELQEIIPSIVDHSVHMLSTRSGSKVVSYCAAYGTPKDRRKIMRQLKGYTRSSLLHKDAYIAILRLLDVTDDTVAIQKNILAEILSHPENKSGGEGANEDGVDSPLLDIALSETGSKMFLLLLASSEKRLFDPFELELLKPAILREKNGDETLERSTSKKNPTTRRKELAQYMRQGLCDLCEKHTSQLMRSKSGSKVLRVVYQSYPSTKLATCMVEACVKSLNSGPNDETLSMFEDPTAHLMIKRILQDEVKLSGKDETVLLSGLLYKMYSGKLIDIATSNRGAFILVFLVRANNISSQVKDELLKGKNITIIKKQKSKKGFEALLKELNVKV